jgi:small neutral amino acid transporter SnatA (MarC family)
MINKVLDMSTPSSDNNKLIAKNTLLLYFRMLFIMFMFLNTNRVILDVLGVEDFGTYNVVGGVAVMLATMQQICNIRQMGESKGHFYELFFALSLPSSVFPNINLKCKLNLYE